MTVEGGDAHFRVRRYRASVSFLKRFSWETVYSVGLQRPHGGGIAVGPDQLLPVAYPIPDTVHEGTETENGECYQSCATMPSLLLGAWTLQRQLI